MQEKTSTIFCTNISLLLNQERNFNENVKLFIQLATYLKNLLPDSFLPSECQGQVHPLKCHPVYLFFPPFPIPPNKRICKEPRRMWFYITTLTDGIIRCPKLFSVISISSLGKFTKTGYSLYENSFALQKNVRCFILWKADFGTHNLKSRHFGNSSMEQDV